MEPVWTALTLTTIAGLSTTIGAFLGIINQKPSARFVSFILAISGGVMIFLSFIEMFIPAWQMEEEGFALLFLAIGLGIGFLFDIILPEEKNVHEHLFNGSLDQDVKGEVESSSQPGGRRFHKHGRNHKQIFWPNQRPDLLGSMDQSRDKIGIDGIYIAYLHILFSAVPAGIVPSHTS